MDELVLERSEFLALLDAVGASAVVGFPSDDLFPADIEAHRQLVAEGHARLAARGLLRLAPNGLRVIAAGLMQIALVVARPEVALVSVREIPGEGPQIFMHYLAADAVVEYTLPTERQHRLAPLAGREALVDRLLVLFPLPEDAGDVQALTLLPESFFAAKATAPSSTTDAVALLTDHGVPADLAGHLADALAAPTLLGTLALLRCEGATLSDARNPLLIVGHASAWMIAQAQPGDPQLRLSTVAQADLRAQLTAWLEELTSLPVTA